jgi:N-acetyl-anhydromuramyl-L-alanine amidase AmpD
MRQLQRIVPVSFVLPILLAGLVGCDEGRTDRDMGNGGIEEEGDEEPQQEPPEIPAGLGEMFVAAGEEFDVPSPILRSVAQVETLWQMVESEVEFEGQVKSFGMMALRGANLEEGAALAGVTVEEASNDPYANIRAAAALMSAMADELGVTDRASIEAWAPVLGEYSGIEHEEARNSYVYGEVMQAVEDSMPEVGDMVGRDILPGDLPDTTLTAPGPDYAASIWRPSPNHSARPAGSAGDPSMVIIHTCEGSYGGCWGWLVNSQAGVSAHYVVNNTGSEISQLVAENRKAWHIGASYNCSLNGSTDCGKNGASSNNFTIGIEHAGYAKQASWDANLIDASARLVCDITQGQDIVRDQYHIVGHGRLQPYNRIDPGPNWPWSDYLALIQSYCNEQPEPEPEPEPEPDPEPDPEPNPDPNAAISIIIDSNDALNGSNADMIVSGNWTSGSGSTDWQTGYWWRSTQSVSDPAVFKFYLDAPATLAVDAWWVSGANRSSAAPFMIYDSTETKVGTVNVNQQQNGGKWNTLGIFQFKAGWNHVDLSAWAPAGFVVVADAVRVRTP